MNLTTYIVLNKKQPQNPHAYSYLQNNLQKNPKIARFMY